jgi:hypothetical protein
MSANNNPRPKMYTGNIDDDNDDPYYNNSNFNRRFYTDKGFRIRIIAVIVASVFFVYAGLAVVQELYIDNNAIGFGGPVDQAIDTYWDAFNKPVASIFGVGGNSAA